MVQMQDPILTGKDNNDLQSNSAPPGTYVVQIPKDQVFRVPPPENAKLYDDLITRGDSRKRSSSCCLYFILFALIFISIFAGSAYFIIFAASPRFSIVSLSVHGLNSSSPQFVASIRAANPNKNLGLYCRSGNTVNISYNGSSLGNGNLPEFYLRPGSGTIKESAMGAKGMHLGNATRIKLGVKNVPLSLRLRMPVKIKVLSVKTWPIIVKVVCDLSVDRFTEKVPSIASQSCRRKVSLW